VVTGCTLGGGGGGLKDSKEFVPVGECGGEA